MSKEFKIAIVVSILLHIIMILFFNYAQNVLTLHRDENVPIEVFLPQTDSAWRIADIAEPEVQKKPEKPSFLGMYDSSVAEQTVAKSEPLAKAKKKGEEAKDRSQEKTAQKKPDKKADQKDLFAMKGPSEKPSKKERQEVSSGGMVGSSSSMPEEYFPDFKYGGHTYLNVERYPEVEYFVRLKRIFRTTWNPVPAIRQDAQGMSVNRGNVSVVLAVSVDRSGELNELFVLRSSGMPSYDSEALRTIKASSPFSTPPEKFVEKDGNLRMSWTFVVYL